MSTKARILVVDDTAPEREAISRLLELESYEVVSDPDVGHAKAHANEPFDLVISDLRMGRESGVDLLRFWKQRSPVTPFILLTAHADIDTAVEAMRLGAEDFLTKPIEPHKLLSRVDQYISRRRNSSEDGTISLPGFAGMVGNAPVMQQVFERARRAAASDSPLLVTGEPGVGKQKLARAVHEQSRRRDEPFQSFCASGLSDKAAMAELFDEASAAGTLFIEELAELSDAVQGRLLRSIDQGNGSRRRVIAGTSRNLERLVRDGQFRNDLYYQLTVLAMRLPPLRERREDIPLLAAYFLRKHSDRLGRSMPRIDPPLLDFWKQYSWPGNIRQLNNTIENMLLMNDSGQLTLNDLPASINRESTKLPNFTMPEGVTLQDLEEAAVRQALDQHGGNRTHAAKSLGISVRTLQRRLKCWGVN